jgi:hypothetical protein
MAQQFQERFLDAILGVLVVPHEDGDEAIDRSPVGLELLPDLLRRAHPATHAS